jgi:hypothetical protein
VLLRLLRFYAHVRKIFGGEGLRKSHEGASSPLQERRRFQTKGFAKATKIPSKNALHSLLHHRVIVAAFNISRMRFAARFTTKRLHGCRYHAGHLSVRLQATKTRQCVTLTKIYYGPRFP